VKELSVSQVRLVTDARKSRGWDRRDADFLHQKVSEGESGSTATRAVIPSLKASFKESRYGKETGIPKEQSQRKEKQ